MLTKINNLGKSFTMRIDDDKTGMISTNGGVYYLDELSVIIITKLDEGKSVSQIASLVMDEYDVTYEEVEKDINSIIKTLNKLKIISDENRIIGTGNKIGN